MWAGGRGYVEVALRSATVAETRGAARARREEMVVSFIFVFAFE